MTLGIFYDHLLQAAKQENKSIVEIALKAKANNICYVDIDGTYWMENQHEVETVLERVNLYIGCVDGRFDLAHDREQDKAEQLIALAAKNHVPHVLLIPGLMAEGEDREVVMDRIAQNLRPLVTYAKTLQVQCSLENYDDALAPYGTWQELLYYMQRVEGIGISFDTGNFTYFGQNAKDALSHLLPHVQLVHCKDRADHSLRGEQGRQAINGRMLYPCAVGSGALPIADMLTTFALAGFDGYLTIEHFDSNAQYQDMISSAEWLTTHFHV